MGRPSDARERLIAATLDLIRREGYPGVTVDAVCVLAEAKKGSFYHFFPSKDDLVVEALDWHWQNRRPRLDALFSPTVPPLERLRRYFEFVYHNQLELKAKYGRFIGCLWSTVGATVNEQSPRVRDKVRSVLAAYERYYERALLDAQAHGEVQIDDVPGKAGTLFAFMEGVLGAARISNDPEIVRNLGRDAFRFLGIGWPETEPAAVPAA